MSKSPTDKGSSNTRADGSRRSGAQPTLPKIAPVLASVIEHIPVSRLQAYKNKLKNHSNQDFHQIAWSIEVFGFNNPIITDANYVVVAGHGRLAAALKLGLAVVPVIKLEHLTPQRVQAYRIADNVLATLVPINKEALKIELLELVESLDVDIEVLGLTTGQIDLVIGGKDEAVEADPDDLVPEEQPVAVSRFGDLWQLGRHRLLVGDAREAASWAKVLEGRKAQAVVTDAPYNVKVSSISGGGKIKHREFACASGDMSRSDFVDFLADVHGRLAENCDDGALIYSYIDWKHQPELLEAGLRCGLNCYHLVVWNKTNAGMGSFYRSKFELVVVFKKGDAPHQNNIQLGRFGRWRSNVWDYPGANTFRRGRMEELSSHPTPKTVLMLADAMRDCTRRGDLVLDAFMGSGSTIVAAERTGRVAAGTEIDPIYGDVIVRRWQAKTGQQAVLADDGRTFDEVARDRGGDEAPEPILAA